MRPRTRCESLGGASHWPVLLVLAAGSMMALAGAAHGQGNPAASDAAPPATSLAAPAEIQPGHPAPVVTGSTGASGPQSATPAPLPPGTRADTPGGSARDGVIAPPAVAGDSDIIKGAPGARALGTPVIPPPGTPGGDPKVVPK